MRFCLICWMLVWYTRSLVVLGDKARNPEVSASADPSGALVERKLELLQKSLDNYPTAQHKAPKQAKSPEKSQSLPPRSRVSASPTTFDTDVDKEDVWGSGDGANPPPMSVGDDEDYDVDGSGSGAGQGVEEEETTPSTVRVHDPHPEVTRPATTKAPVQFVTDVAKPPTKRSPHTAASIGPLSACLLLLAWRALAARRN